MYADIKNACTLKCKLTSCILCYIYDEHCKHSDNF